MQSIDQLKTGVNVVCCHYPLSAQYLRRYICHHSSHFTLLSFHLQVAKFKDVTQKRRLSTSIVFSLPQSCNCQKILLAIRLWRCYHHHNFLISFFPSYFLSPLSLFLSFVRYFLESFRLILYFSCPSVNPVIL